MKVDEYKLIARAPIAHRVRIAEASALLQVDLGALLVVGRVDDDTLEFRVEHIHSTVRTTAQRARTLQVLAKTCKTENTRL